MTQFASPVLHSLLDTDAYKLHMQQAVFHHYYDVHVAAEFRCRGDDLLGIYADAIREQVQAMQHLRLQDDEYQWLSALPFFRRPTILTGYASSALTRNKSPCPTIMASWIFV
ncbi:hypothetical protein EIMP300_63830 [Escherichia coli]|uniref:Nicotinate phosphoribosyltransferase N-terminal domain-containing protein n=1 Tax=Escherichia coli TaxID=562 RepID=A0A8S0FY95_ECOLX|nr:hypothetical protein EIMP300_63830 [Escherichia coli]